MSQGQNEIHLVNETNVLSGVKLYLSVCNQHIIIQNKTPAFTYNCTMQTYKTISLHTTITTGFTHTHT